MAKRTPQDWEDLYYRLHGQADDLATEAAIQAMLDEPRVCEVWWDGVFPPSPEQHEQLEQSARCFARGDPLPSLSPAQRARLALRIRLASRLARAFSARHSEPTAGWVGRKLSALPEAEAIEWLLTDGWRLAAEVLDETLHWADEIEVRPPAPCHKPAPPPSPEPDKSNGSN